MNVLFEVENDQKATNFEEKRKMSKISNFGTLVLACDDPETDERVFLSMYLKGGNLFFDDMSVLSLPEETVDEFYDRRKRQALMTENFLRLVSKKIHDFLDTYKHPEIENFDVSIYDFWKKIFHKQGVFSLKEMHAKLKSQYNISDERISENIAKSLEQGYLLQFNDIFITINMQAICRYI